jgi:hypothetical protein
MKKYILILASVFVGSQSYAQGVKDPATPNAGAVYQSTPAAQPSRPTATKNIPPAYSGPPLGVRPAYRRGYRPGARTR